jgi:hypothetical protein
MTIETLPSTLRQAGNPVELFVAPDGSRVLALPYGGRILGLFTPASPENFFWTNPTLASVDSARGFYESPEWHNSGGDRTWLAPEIDFFLPDFPSTERYWQPRELDPGSYQVQKSDSALTLINELALTYSRSKTSVSLRVTKRLSPAPSPLRHERERLEQVAYAGYTLTSRLELLDGPGVQAGLWHLLQLPHGGEMLIPTYSRTEPTVCFGTIAPGDLTCEERLLRYRMHAPGAQKISVRAVAITGRMGYVYGAGDQCALVVRNFSVNPSGDYVDVPWTDPCDFGYAAQACSIDNELGAFSELEYHVPAIGPGRTSCEDVSQVWAFRGSAGDIQSIARTLLSAEVTW